MTTGMDRATAILVDGLGAAAATSGILSHLQGRIFGLLYVRAQPLSLDEIAATLEQSKSNISVNMHGLVEWHLVRRVSIAGSRRDHYEAATNFWRVMQEIMERRFRWTVRQVLITLGEAERAAGGSDGSAAARALGARFEPLRAFFAAVDAGIGTFTEGKPLDPETLKTTSPPSRKRTAAARRRDSG